MEKEKLIQRLNELQGIYSERMIPSKREGCYDVKVNVEGHQHLLFLVADLIKVSILALEECEHRNDPQIPTPQLNICQVLRLGLELIPYEHMEFIEEVEKLLKNSQRSSSS